LIILRRFAEKHGIAAAETARSCSGIALPDETILEATETDSLELGAGGVKSTCKALVIKIAAYDCIVGRPWLDRHNPHVNWRKNRLMIVKNGSRYDLDARKYPFVGKGKHVKLLSAKQLRRMVKGKPNGIGNPAGHRKEFCTEKWNTFQTLGKSSRELQDGVSGGAAGISNNSKR
jgi:hypothetical protein